MATVLTICKLILDVPWLTKTALARIMKDFQNDQRPIGGSVLLLIGDVVEVRYSKVNTSGRTKRMPEAFGSLEICEENYTICTYI